MNTQKIHNLAMVIMMLLASGCAGAAQQGVIAAGEVIPISTDSTLWIMRGAVNGARDCFTMTNGSAYLFGRYLGGSGWGFVAVDAGKSLTPANFGWNGNGVNTSDMSAVIEPLLKDGWKKATVIEETLRMSILESAIWQISRTFYTFAVFFVPVSMQDVDGYFEMEAMVQ